MHKENQKPIESKELLAIKTQLFFVGSADDYIDHHQPEMFFKNY